MAIFEAVVLVTVFTVFMILLLLVLLICLKHYKTWLTRAMLVGISGLLYPLGLKALFGMIQMVA